MSKYSLGVAALGLVAIAAAASAAGWVLHDADVSEATEILDREGIPFNVLENLQMVTFQEAAGYDLLLGKGKLTYLESAELHLDKSVPETHGDQVRDHIGVVRNGPTVLVVDTGVDSAHPAFAESMVANIQPLLRGTLVIGSLAGEVVVDSSGHGTHVAGTVAGDGGGLGQTNYEGMYHTGRVASYQATAIGNTEAQAEIDLLAALEAFEWALDNQDQYNIRVVTNSWGTNQDYEPDHPIQEATRQLYLAGMNVFFSAGNTGKEDNLSMYCQAPWVMCVAAGTLSRARADFSSYGSTDPDKPWAHPDITAPGVAITSAVPAASAGGDLLQTVANRNLYGDKSGTSMATPHVAGAAALLLAANPELSPDQVMDIIAHTADPMADGVERVGAGYLNVREAFNLAVATPGYLDSFLSGEQVKYAGERSGDPNHERDAITDGFDGVEPTQGLLEAPPSKLWITTPWGIGLTIYAVAWVLLAVGWKRRS